MIFLKVLRARVVTMTMAAGGKLTSRNLRTERVIGGKYFWISGGDLGDLIELDMYDVVQVWVSEAR